MIEPIKRNTLESPERASIRRDSIRRASIRRFTTLVVDDEPELANIAGELLTYHDIDALVVYSAQEALALLDIHKDIDAIFSDVMMPSMTGLDLAETVSETYPKINIVLTSGFTAQAYWERYKRCYSFIAKPYSIDAVIRLLKG